MNNTCKCVESSDLYNGSMTRAKNLAVRSQGTEVTEGKRVVFAGGAPGSAALDKAAAAASRVRRVFLLSPANAAGARAQMLLRSEAESDLAKRLRAGAATVGEIFSFMSALYFRGKLAYARAFADPPPEVPSVLVIMPSRGLLPPDTVVTLREMQEVCTGRIDLDDMNYRGPLERDAALLQRHAGCETQIVLLGSIATPKYIEPLLQIFGSQLFFPSDFVGRGQLSRGGLLLRCCGEGAELAYVPVATATRTATRPPRLLRNCSSGAAASE